MESIFRDVSKDARRSMLPDFYENSVSNLSVPRFREGTRVDASSLRFLTTINENNDEVRREEQLITTRARFVQSNTFSRWVRRDIHSRTRKENATCNAIYPQTNGYLLVANIKSGSRAVENFACDNPPSRRTLRKEQPLVSRTRSIHNNNHEQADAGT